MKPVRVAVVDDSSFLRKAIARMLSDDPTITVVGTAASGEELLANLDRWRPEVITLDLSMPGMGGLSTLDHIQARSDPPQVIILSTHSAKDAPLTFEALARGAIDFIDKQQYSLVDFKTLRQVLVQKILEVAHRTAPTSPPPAAVEEIPPTQLPFTPSPVPGSYEIILIGASTGGPQAIERLLKDLGPGLPVPVAIVQHMPASFTRAFAERLNAYLALEVREAEDDEPLLAGTVYIAPGGVHLRIARSGGLLVARLTPSPETATHRPSVDILFASAERAAGSRIIAVLLTGMGRDGTQGMIRLAQAGAYTIAQDEATSVLWGMPRAAILESAVREILPLERIGTRLVELLRASPAEGRRDRGEI